MMPMIATTMRSSINENPSWRLVVMLISCSLYFEYQRSTVLVAKRCHRRAHNQSSRVGDRGQRVVAIHHTNFRDAEATSTGLRNTTGGGRKTVSAEDSGSTRTGLFDDCE